MHLSTLAEYNKTAKEPLKNARNAAAGALRNLVYRARQAFAPFPAGRQKHPRPGARAEAASAPFPARQGERLSSYLLLIVLFCPVFLSPSPAGRWKAVFRRPDQLLFSLGGITDFLFPVAGHQLSATEQISKQ